MSGHDAPDQVPHADDPVGVRLLPWTRRLLLSAVLGLIRCYQQWISPGLAPRCRFHPSCSSYAVEALTAHGIGRGGLLALRRLLRCHPWNPGGLDPVPLPRVAPAQGHASLIAASPPTSPGA